MAHPFLAPFYSNHKHKKERKKEINSHYIDAQFLSINLRETSSEAFFISVFIKRCIHRVSPNTEQELDIAKM